MEEEPEGYTRQIFTHNHRDGEWRWNEEMTDQSKAVLKANTQEGN